MSGNWKTTNINALAFSNFPVLAYGITNTIVVAGTNINWSSNMQKDSVGPDNFNLVKIVPLAGLTGFSAIISNTNLMELTWNDIDGETGYVIATNSRDAVFATVPADTFSWTDVRNNVGKSITYYVYATNSFGSSAVVSSNIAYNQPTLAGGLGAVILSTNSIFLTWTDAGIEDGYTIYTNGVIAANLAQNITSYTLANLSYTNTYTMSIIATSALGDSSPSTNILKLDKPDATTVTLDDTKEKEITISWTDVSGEDGYNILRNTVNVPGSATKISTQLAGTTTFSFKDTGLDDETVYYYWVEAYNVLGTNISAIATGTTISTGPKFAADLSGLKIGPTTVFGSSVGSVDLYIDKLTEDAEISIYDIKGRKIWTKMARELDDKNGYKIVDPDVVLKLADGQYIMLIKDSASVKTKKFHRITKTQN
jgi:hypothetical protein